VGAEPDLKTVSINVDSSGGVITLKGTTDSQDKRKKAEQVAENVAGVRSVRNEMVVIKG
jgi:osmotically-inducible protein OsmY